MSTILFIVLLLLKRSSLRFLHILGGLIYSERLVGQPAPDFNMELC